MARVMKDSGIEWIGQIPKQWDIEKNKHCFICSKKIVGDESSNTQLLSLTTKGVRMKSQEDVGGKIPESYDTYQKVEENDLIMCLFDLDCSAVFSGISPYAGMVSPAYKILKCKDNYISRFAEYWFKFVFDGRKFKSYSKNLRYTLSYDEFGILPIVYLSREEQQKIADFLDKKCASIDAVIEKTKDSIEEYKKLKQAIITQAVTKGIRPNRKMKYSGVKWIGEIPEEWLIQKLKKNSVVIGDGIHSSPEYDDNGEYFFVNGNNIGEEYLVIKEDTNRLSSDERKKYPMELLNNNTIMIALNGATYGKTSLYKEYPVLLGKSAGYITLKENSCRKYIRYFLQSTPAKNMMALSLNGTTIQNLSLTTLKDFLTPFPEKEEQIEISNYLDNKCKSIDSIIRKKEIELEEVGNLKKSLIYEYVTGKKEAI